MTIQELEQKGELIDTANEGTSQLWRVGTDEYVVLCDNTVITRDEDEQCVEGPIFPRPLDAIHCGDTTAYFTNEEKADGFKSEAESAATPEEYDAVWLQYEKYMVATNYHSAVEKWGQKEVDLARERRAF